MRKCAYLLVLALSLTGGCGGDRGISRSPRTKGSSALAVGSQIITGDEIIEHEVAGVSLAERLGPIAQTNDLEGFKEQVRGELEQIVLDKISYILLYERVKRDVGENIDIILERQVEKLERDLVAASGGDYAKAEQRLREEEGMDLEGFREHRRKLILLALQMPEPGPITHSELLSCYNRMKDEFFSVAGTIQLRLIDIEVAELRLVDPNQSRLEQARELAEGLVRRIREGEDFSALAKQYSHGYRRDFGGLWKPRQPENLEKPYDILTSQAEKMEPGDVAGPIETETKNHIFIVKLEDKQPKSVKPLKEVQREVEQIILIERKGKAVEELYAKLAQQEVLVQKEEFIDFCLEKIYRMSNR